MFGLFDVFFLFADPFCLTDDGTGRGAVFLKGNFGKKVWEIFRKICSVQDRLLRAGIIEELNPKLLSMQLLTENTHGSKNDIIQMSKCSVED
jgi:hypothetical protein